MLWVIAFLTGLTLISFVIHYSIGTIDEFEEPFRLERPFKFCLIGSIILIISGFGAYYFDKVTANNIEMIGDYELLPFPKDYENSEEIYYLSESANTRKLYAYYNIPGKGLDKRKLPKGTIIHREENSTPHIEEYAIKSKIIKFLRLILIFDFNSKRYEVYIPTETIDIFTTYDVDIK